MDSRADLAAQPGLGAGCSAGVVPARRGNRHPSITPYETYEAADRPFAVAVGNDRLFARLCAAIGLPELAGDERFATNTARVAQRRRARRARSSAVFAHATGRRTGSSVLRAASVPVGPINDVAEAYALAEALGLEPIARGRTASRCRAAAAVDGERPASAGARRGSTSTATSCRPWLSCARRAPRRSPAGSVFGSMKRTSSRMTSNSETSSVPRVAEEGDEPLRRAPRARSRRR